MHVEAVLSTQAKDRLGFQAKRVETLEVDLEGIVGNRHRGWTRAADSRVPYLKRGTTIRNERQVSLVSIEDLAEIARRLEIERVDPAWIGANVVVSGIALFSHLPRGTHLFAPGGTILIVTDMNAPCTLAGEAVASHVPGRPEIKLQFPKLAQGLRGVVATVEHPGAIKSGDALTARVPAQWVYPQA
jgi:hypothetical protein